MAFSTEETLALQALRGGELRLEDGAWWIVADDHARQVPTRLVQGLRGEGLLEPASGTSSGRSAFRLTARGLRVAQAAFDGLAARGAADERAARTLLRRGPLALLRPAADSEEVDYLLAIRTGESESREHRARMALAHDAAAADPENFVHLQFHADVAALPISPALASRGLVPRAGDTYRILDLGLDASDVDALGARGCPDRGVNYLAGHVQWFGGFGEADPLITTPQVPHTIVLRMLASADPATTQVPRLGPPSTDQT